MKDLRIYLSVGTALLVFYLIAQYNKPKPVNWKVSFERTDKIPYGTYVTYNRLSDIFPGAAIRAERQAPYVALVEDSLMAGSYLIVAESARVDEYDFRQLEKFMRRGNNVFIAAYHMGSYLTDSLHLIVNTDIPADKSKTVTVNFVNPALGTPRGYAFNKGIGSQFFGRYDSAKAVILGVNNHGHPTFIRYQYGKGYLYLMAGPYFFTNYNMLQPRGAEYVAKALSYLPAGKMVIWDEFSVLGALEDQSPMSVLLRYRPLAWAYYLTLFSLVLFVLYEVKRRQRIIPVIEPLKNATAEFVGQVGRVYYDQRDHGDIARKKVRYLQEYVRARYNLKMEQADKAFTERLISRSGLPAELIFELMLQVGQVKKYPSVTQQQLIELNKAIEAFYKNSQ